MERYETICNDMKLERPGTFMNARRTFRQESYDFRYFTSNSLISEFEEKKIILKYILTYIHFLRFDAAVF
jgi:hypothetical protein